MKSPPAIPAQDSDAWYKAGVLGYMIDGGYFMWPILLLAVIALAVIIERYRSLQMLTVDKQALRDQVLDLLHANRGEEALELCNQSRGPVPAILSVGLRKFLMLKRLDYDPAKMQEQVSKAMDDYAPHIVAALEKHLPILATISSVAPMLGSVGTVVGMVVLFNDLAGLSSSDPIVQRAAAGIKIKLLVTVWGLLVGIPAYIAFNYFTTVIDRYVLQVEETATELFEAVTLRLALERQNVAQSNGAARAGSGQARRPEHMKMPRKSRRIFEPPAVLLTDLAFNLVIFFVVCASTEANNGRKQAIPRGTKDPTATAKDQNVEVELARTTLTVNGSLVPLEDLPAKLQPMLAGKKRRRGPHGRAQEQARHTLLALDSHHRPDRKSRGHRRPADGTVSRRRRPLRPS